MAGLLAQGRNIAPDAAEGSGPRRVAEGAGDLLLHLDHAQVPFGLVVVEGHGPVMQEGEDRALAGRQAVECWMSTKTAGGDH